MDYWEYQCVYLRTRTDDINRINDFLNDMGRNGWELVNVIAASGGSQDILIHSYYFKRHMK